MEKAMISKRMNKPLFKIGKEIKRHFENFKFIGSFVQNGVGYWPKKVDYYVAMYNNGRIKRACYLIIANSTSSYEFLTYAQKEHIKNYEEFLPFLRNKRADFFMEKLNDSLKK
jgi:hypothetical protein